MVQRNVSGFFGAPFLNKCNIVVLVVFFKCGFRFQHQFHSILKLFKVPSGVDCNCSENRFKQIFFNRRLFICVLLLIALTHDEVFCESKLINAGCKILLLNKLFLNFRKLVFTVIAGIFVPIVLGIEIVKFAFCVCTRRRLLHSGNYVW